MTARLLPPDEDPNRPAPADRLTVRFQGEALSGVQGQTLAGVILGSGRLDWRRTSREGRPRGLFCGIGVCFDCLVVVNGQRDVRACQRRARDGDTVEIQHDELPRPVAAAPQQAARDDAGRRDPGAADD
jgi:hypothetical protein